MKKKKKKKKRVLVYVKRSQKQKALYKIMEKVPLFFINFPKIIIVCNLLFGNSKIIKLSMNYFTYLMLAASLTYFPQPNNGGAVTIKVYSQIKAIVILAPLFVKCEAENGQLTRQYRS